MDFIFRIDEDKTTDKEIVSFSINGSNNEDNLRVIAYLNADEVDANTAWPNASKIEILDKESGAVVYTSTAWNYRSNTYIVYNKNVGKFEAQVTYIHKEL